MKGYNIPFSLILLWTIFLWNAAAIRTKDKIYVNIKGQKACFRRLNSTHQIGCSSEMKGNVGVVHYVKEKSDSQWILKDGPHAPYVMLIEAANFNLQNITELIDSGRVNGILVIDANGASQLPPEGFSADKSCPNDGYGLYWNNTMYKNCRSVQWNPPGSGMMFQDFSIPIFLLDSPKEVEYIIEKCYERYNNPENNTGLQYPLCAAELKDYMNAAKDSMTCMRRSSHMTSLTTSMMHYCDPLSNNNVIGFVNPKSVDDQLAEKSVIIAGSRMDYMNMFENVNNSADNPITSIVALLSAAEAIGRFKEDFINSQENKTILFAFFQGEAFDYIGSSRMVYDMEVGSFPTSFRKTGGLSYSRALQKIGLNHLSHFLEVNQLGYRENEAENVWLHTDPMSYNSNISTEIDGLVKKIKKIGEQLNVTVMEPNTSRPLPPSSAQRFLRETALPTVMLTNHEKEFTNIYYNSMFDLGELIGVDYIPGGDVENLTLSKQVLLLTNISTVLAQTLFELGTGQKGSHIKANSSIVAELLYCYIRNSSCSIFHSVITSDYVKSFEKFPEMNLYTGVRGNTSPLTLITEKLLAYFLGDKLNVTDRKSCTKQSNGIVKANWMQGRDRQGLCVIAPTYLTDAISPAFIIDDYDWLSGKYSTWTESIWDNDAMSVRVFLVPSNKLQAVTLFLGVLILCLSMVIVYFLNNRAEVIFPTTSAFPAHDG
ncbi:nicastrin-like isoform X1 [Octopus vulgaris]|uniref:Nicastrin-like isoform X1 n=2 Tax=Octopus TaxID=6643 RepID=A0AA36BQ69_OCTVU|nr:nicastrin isoform X1 [Octopus sinensis]CAI9737672.1 nicastrin-like isoform X1 [Octopus vulgaris]